MKIVKSKPYCGQPYSYKQAVVLHVCFRSEKVTYTNDKISTAVAYLWKCRLNSRWRQRRQCLGSGLLMDRRPAALEQVNLVLNTHQQV